MIVMAGNFKKSAATRRIAEERIITLFDEAKKEFSNDRKLSNRYIELARKIAMKYRLKIPSGLQKQFCKHCYSFLLPGKNLRIRTQKGHLVYYCLECKKFMRFPYTKKRTENKSHK